MYKIMSGMVAATLCVMELHGNEYNPNRDLDKIPQENSSEPSLEGSNQILLSNDGEDKFVDVIHYLLQQEPKQPFDNAPVTQMINLEVAVDAEQILVKSAKKQSNVRNYLVSVTPSEKEDLTYITTTLAKGALTKLAGSKSSLKKAGDRIDHLHPLRFLMTIFTDEELKANMHAIRSRGWVWDKFYDGLESSLKEESKKNNMRVEFIVDFANTIGINPSLIQPIIVEKRWKDFINTLLDTIPRTGNPGRYDM